MISKKVFFLIALSVCLYSLYEQTKMVVSIENLKGEPVVLKMSRREARRLENFFRELILADSWAYTLSGNKPMSFTCFQKPFSSLSFFMPPNLTLLFGWETWEKYSSYLENPRFQMSLEEGEDGLYTIYIIDKLQFSNAISENWGDFQQILQNGELDQLLSGTKGKPLIKEVLKNHPVLLGILLGYGKNNAWWFFNRNQNLKNSSVWEPELIDPIKNKYCQEYFSLRKRDISCLLLPIFVGEGESEESLFLKNKYLKVREKIIDYFQRKDFLEASLSLYKNGPSILSSGK